MVEHFFLYNDKIHPAGDLVVGPENRAFRYGDGLFETMKMVKGHILNKEFHFERLFKGLGLLYFEPPKTFNAVFVEKKIKEIAAKNGHTDVARIRLVIFRGNGGIFDPGNHPNYIIETLSVPPGNLLNETGLVVDVFPDTRKSCDLFSNIKSNSYLPYVLAGLFAKRNGLDECLLLNSFERVCDGTIANIFIIKGSTICTPPLTEGCVEGTMRRWMLEKFSLKKYRVIEKELSTNDLLNADELFLTNAITHLRWIRKFGLGNYSNNKVREIYNHILQTI